jgi:hypothetical protein
MSGLIPQKFAAELKPLPATNERKFYRPEQFKKCCCRSERGFLSFGERCRSLVLSIFDLWRRSSNVNVNCYLASCPVPVPYPNGIPSISPRLARSAYLGYRPNHFSTATRLHHRSFSEGGSQNDAKTQKDRPHFFQAAWL